MGATEVGLEFKNWSEGRHLNPGPYGPEPSWLHVLEYPGGSAEVRLNSNCHSSVYVRVLHQSQKACTGECGFHLGQQSPPADEACGFRREFARGGSLGDRHSASLGWA